LSTPKILIMAPESRAKAGQSDCFTTRMRQKRKMKEKWNKKYRPVLVWVWWCLPSALSQVLTNTSAAEIFALAHKFEPWRREPRNRKISISLTKTCVWNVIRCTSWLTVYIHVSNYLFPYNLHKYIIQILTVKTNYMQRWRQ